MRERLFSSCVWHDGCCTGQAQGKSQREKEQKRRGRQTVKEGKLRRRRRIASGSKSVRSGPSSYPAVCPSSDGFGTKITAATRSQYSVMAKRYEISRTAFQLWLYKHLKKII